MKTLKFTRQLKTFHASMLQTPRRSFHLFLKYFSSIFLKKHKHNIHEIQHNSDADMMCCRMKNIPHRNTHEK